MQLCEMAMKDLRLARPDASRQIQQLDGSQHLGKTKHVVGAGQEILRDRVPLACPQRSQDLGLRGPRQIDALLDKQQQDRDVECLILGAQTLKVVDEARLGRKQERFDCVSTELQRDVR